MASKNISADKLFFDGTGDVNRFVEKAELVANCKGHADENKANFIASKLGGSAFDVYRRLSTEDKKDHAIIKAELLKEFSREERNREEALNSLMNSARMDAETPQSFAYRLLKLVKLAYSNLDNDSQKTIGMDYYIRGVSKELQIALKSLSNFSSMDVHRLSDETTRLEIAGVKAECKIQAVHIEEAHEETLNKITKNVLEKLRGASVQDLDVGEEVNVVNSSTASSSRRRGNFQRRGNGRGRYNQYRRQQNEQGSRRCRCCQSTSHLFRECPVRHCQACGGKGHDAWDSACPNYS